MSQPMKISDEKMKIQIAENCLTNLNMYSVSLPKAKQQSMPESDFFTENP